MKYRPLTLSATGWIHTNLCRTAQESQELNLASVQGSDAVEGVHDVEEIKYYKNMDFFSAHAPDYSSDEDDGDFEEDATKMPTDVSTSSDSDTDNDMHVSTNASSHVDKKPRTDYADDLIVPMSSDVAERLQHEARQKGFKQFLFEQRQAQADVHALIYAFGFDLPAAYLDLEVDQVWMLFGMLLRKFCARRERTAIHNTIDDAVELLKSSKRILVLTGAGISVSCGIPDFRSEKGLYATIGERWPDLDDPQLLFDIEYFRHNPVPFFELAREIFPSHFKPSLTHKFIKHLEDRDVLMRNYTQNIDTLEKQTGIKKVVHCHGSFDTASCQLCGVTVDCNVIKPDIMEQRIPHCKICPEMQPDTTSEENIIPVMENIMKPNIVFFGEKLSDDFDNQIEADREHVDLLLVIGSSLGVAPVSSIVGYIPHSVPIILINREPVYHLHHSFDVQLLGYCDGIVKDLCKRLGWDEAIFNLDSNSVTEDQTPVEITHIEPNIYLYPGAVFNQERHRRTLQPEYETDSESEAEKKPNHVPDIVTPVDVTEQGTDGVVASEDGNAMSAEVEDKGRESDDSTVSGASEVASLLGHLQEGELTK